MFCQTSDCREKFPYEVSCGNQFSMTLVNMAFFSAPDKSPENIAWKWESTGLPIVVKITWKPLDTKNGIILLYEICYSRKPSLSVCDSQRNVTAEESSVTLGNLLNATAYYFKIRARTSGGYGPYSQEYHFTTSSGEGTNEDRSFWRMGSLKSGWVSVLRMFLTNSTDKQTLRMSVLLISWCITLCSLECRVTFACIWRCLRMFGH